MPEPTEQADPAPASADADADADADAPTYPPPIPLPLPAPAAKPAANTPGNLAAGALGTVWLVLTPFLALTTAASLSGYGMVGLGVLLVVGGSMALFFLPTSRWFIRSRALALAARLVLSAAVAALLVAAQRPGLALFYAVVAVLAVMVVPYFVTPDASSKAGDT